MAINTTRLCTRLGKLIGGLNDLNTWRGTTFPGRISTIYGQYSSVDSDLVDGIFTLETSAQNNLNLVPSYYAALASDVIIREVRTDRPEISADIFSASTEWLRQFKLASDTFKYSPTAASVSHTAGSSDTAVAALAPGDLAIPDTYVLTVTTDSERGAAAWQTPITVLGTTLADPLGITYPQGSGVAATITELDGSQDIGLTNGSLAAFTVANTPDNWTATTGTIGTNIRSASGVSPRGDTRAVLRLTNVATVTNTTPALPPGGYVTWSFRVKKLVDDGGTLDVNVGTNNVFSNTIGGLSSSWTTYSGIAKLSSSLAGNQKVSVAISGGAGTDDIYVADVGVSQVQALYPLGVYLAAWSGIVPTTVTDQWSAPVTLSSGSMTTQLLRGIDRLVGLRYMGLEFPTTSGTATQPDSLVS